MSASLLLVGWLTVVWVGLWGSLTAANVLGGLVVAAGTPEAVVQLGSHTGKALAGVLGRG